MKTIKLTGDNKNFIVSRYVDYIVGRMNNVEIFDEFKDYIYREKMAYPNDTLEQEIKRYCPDILEDHFVDSVVGKGSEYASTIS